MGDIVRHTLPLISRAPLCPLNLSELQGFAHLSELFLLSTHNE